MTLYAGIDLHSNNSVVVIQDDHDKVVNRRRLENRLETVLAMLEPHRGALGGVVVESTYNWYVLVVSVLVRQASALGTVCSTASPRKNCVGWSRPNVGLVVAGEACG